MATKEELRNKRQKAKQLYAHSGMLQQDIAELLDVSEKTISQWKASDDWEKYRAAVTTTKQKELARIYAQLADLNASIEQREEGKRYASSSEADIISKLSSAIAKLEAEQGLSATVNVFIGFTTYLRRSEDLETAKLFTELSDRYIKSLI